MRITNSLSQNGLQSEFQASRLQSDILSQGKVKIIVLLMLLILRGSPPTILVMEEEEILFFSVT